MTQAELDEELRLDEVWNEKHDDECNASEAVTLKEIRSRMIQGADPKTADPFFPPGLSELSRIELAQWRVNLGQHILLDIVLARCSFLFDHFWYDVERPLGADEFLQLLQRMLFPDLTGASTEEWAEQFILKK